MAERGRGSAAAIGAVAVTAALTALAGVLLAAARPAQEPPVFRAGVEVVYLDVFVSRDGVPVRGLTAENFVVLDDGVPQRVRLLELEDVAMGVTLAFDTSASLQKKDLVHLKEAGHAVLDGLREGDRAALLTFDYSPRLRVGLTPDAERVRREIDAIESRGSTTLYDGLYAALALPTGDLRPIVVVFTDGHDTASWLTAEQVLEEVALSPAVIQIVAVEPPPPLDNPRRFRRLNDRVPNRESPHVRWLREIAERTGGLYWPAESTDRLKATFLSVVEDLAARYVLAFEPQGVALEGVHTLEVKLQGAKGAVRAREQYAVR